MATENDLVPVLRVPHRRQHVEDIPRVAPGWIWDGLLSALLQALDLLADFRLSSRLAARTQGLGALAVTLRRTSS